ncbi:MAG TPA: nucleotidyltransferase family protein [Candidatus Acidoferrum sp.]|jgi:NDP-sugar pyrophosphorylase family protein
MKAMILAAGLGTRLHPLTDQRPKALVEVAGRTMLEIALLRLASFGVTEFIVNVHHFADQVVQFLESKNNFGMRIEISREDVLLDTGGGLKKAAWFFQENNSAEPFFLHNVDVLSNIDLAQMAAEHRASGALATLAVQSRESSRQLFFDEGGQLCGRRKRGAADEFVRQAPLLTPLAFSGIHVISPRFLTLIDKVTVFSIIDTYLHGASRGERICAYSADRAYWVDLGKPENIRQVEGDLRAGVVKQ